jgi:hypothetical protein
VRAWWLVGRTLLWKPLCGCGASGWRPIPGRGEYSLVVMAPSNAAAAELSAAIRAERRQRGEVGPDQIVIQAVDRAGKRELAIGAGDEVRVYKRIRDGRTVVANNGDTLRVLRADRNGMDVIGAIR